MDSHARAQLLFEHSKGKTLQSAALQKSRAIGSATYRSVYRGGATFLPPSCGEGRIGIYMKFQQLKAANVHKQMAIDINNLLRQLLHDPTTYRAISISALKKIVGEKSMIVLVALDNKHIIGIGMLQLVNKFRGRYAYVEDMMVDENYRGKGIGTTITKKLIELARKKAVTTIELSTRPSRVAANKLYQKLGFQQKETNVYRLKL